MIADSPYEAAMDAAVLSRPALSILGAFPRSMAVSYDASKAAVEFEKRKANANG